MDEVADWGGINKWKEFGSLVSFPSLLIIEFDLWGGEVGEHRSGRAGLTYRNDGSLDISAGIFF